LIEGGNLYSVKMCVKIMKGHLMSWGAIVP
jgi:hypothetical protein